MASNPFCESQASIRRLYIFGAGGFGREVAWLAEQCWGSEVERRFVVDQPAYLCPPINGVEVELLDEASPIDGDRFIVAIGEPGLRRKAAAACIRTGLQPIHLVHPRVEMSARVELDEGVVVCAGSIITTNVRLGAHVHVNLACTIGHDVSIGDYTTLSPGVHVSGHVEIAEDVFIGTGANIINGSATTPLVIGKGAVIAAGACVTRPVEPGALVAGVPAVRKR